MIEVELVCDVCGARKKSPDVNTIDRYDYHDAPSDGVTFWEPKGWYFSAQGYSQVKDLLALCPEHNTEDERHHFLTGRARGVR